MRATLHTDDELLKKAKELTGITEKSTLVRPGLEALVSVESGKQLAKLAGTEKTLEMITRRRSGEVRWSLSIHRCGWLISVMET